jgi:hypothetical protein
VQTMCSKISRESYGNHESINGFADDGVFVDAAGNSNYKIMGELTLAMVRRWRYT